jgi:predicted RNA binding protein YcfA (HicA-like mRNA interferase family)
MSPKLPVLSGDDLIKSLKQFGYEPVRQAGSHVQTAPIQPNRNGIRLPCRGTKH